MLLLLLLLPVLLITLVLRRRRRLCTDGTRVIYKLRGPYLMNGTVGKWKSETADAISLRSARCSVPEARRRGDCARASDKLPCLVARNGRWTALLNHRTDRARSVREKNALHFRRFKCRPVVLYPEISIVKTMKNDPCAHTRDVIYYVYLRTMGTPVWLSTYMMINVLFIKPCSVSFIVFEHIL